MTANEKISILLDAQKALLKVCGHVCVDYECEDVDGCGICKAWLECEDGIEELKAREDA